MMHFVWGGEAVACSHPSSTLLLSSFFHSPPISRRHQSPPPPPPLAAVFAADPVSWSLQFPNMLHLLEKSALLVSFNWKVKIDSHPSFSM
ncbi:hypothetical protein Droror1_Dr00018342 [Drosera rotundifolia]